MPIVQLVLDYPQVVIGGRGEIDVRVDTDQRFPTLMAVVVVAIGEVSPRDLAGGATVRREGALINA
jgi:hypothetical protein